MTAAGVVAADGRKELPRQLSSGQTLYFKFVQPVLGIAGFGAATLLAFAGALDDSAIARAVPHLKWLLLAGWLGATPLLLATNAGLKRVRLDAHTLYVSNFRDEIAVPVSEIESVLERRWLRLHPVTIKFRTATPMGRAITFMPVGRMFGFLTGHPVVDELRRAAAHARQGWETQ